MKNLIKACALALALAGASSVMAQPQAGDWEFTLGGGGSSDQDFERNSMGINGSIGYFFNEHFELGVRQGVNFSGVTDDEEWFGSTLLAADWHFMTGGKFVPFIGVSTGATYTEDDIS